MERRVECRVTKDEAVDITVFGDAAGYQLSGRLANLTGRGMQLIVPRHLTAGTLLAIHALDRLYLGESVYCSAEGTSYRVGVEIEQALRHTAELTRLRESLAQMSLPGGSSKQADDTMKVSPHGSRELRSKEDR